MGNHRSFSWKLAALLPLVVLSFSFAVEPPPLPEAQVVKSSLKSAEQAISAMHLSCGEQLASGGDLVAIEEQAIRDFTQGKGRFASLGAPASRKRIVLVRYTISDKRITSAIADAKTAGLAQVHVLT